MARLGPTGQYPHDTPINRSDRGSLWSSFHVFKEYNAVAINFGGPVDWLAIEPQHAINHAGMFQSAITEAFGPLTYNASELPMRIVANEEKRMVEVYFHEAVCLALVVNKGILVGNPHMFLAFAEKLQDAGSALLSKR